jgi:hypothetical protein
VDPSKIAPASPAPPNRRKSPRLIPEVDRASGGVTRHLEHIPPLQMLRRSRLPDLRACIKRTDSYEESEPEPVDSQAPPALERPLARC